MSNNVVFLYKIKDTDDRDAFAYIEDKPLRWSCDHYFSGIGIMGACYSGGEFADYADIITILTEEEYNTLLAFKKFIHDLGYGMTKGDDRYNSAIEEAAKVQPIFDKLNSEENEALLNELWEEEKEILYDDYGLDDDDCEKILAEYDQPYKDRSIVCAVYDDAYDLGYEEAVGCGYVKSDDDFITKYFDFEKFGNDLVDDDERYIELDDGRCVILSY
jgi:hypothetical protein